MFFIFLIFILFLIKNFNTVKPWIWLIGRVSYLFVGLVITHLFFSTKVLKGSTLLHNNEVNLFVVFLYSFYKFAALCGIFNYYLYIYQNILTIFQSFITLFLLRNVFKIKFTKFESTCSSVFYFFLYSMHIIFLFFNLNFWKLITNILISFYTFIFNFKFLNIFFIFISIPFIFYFLFFYKLESYEGVLFFLNFFEKYTKVFVNIFFVFTEKSYLNFFDYFANNYTNIKSLILKNQNDLINIKESSIILINYNFNYLEITPIFNNFFILNLTSSEDFLKNKLLLKKTYSIRTFSTKNKQANPKIFFKNLNYIFDDNFYFYKNNTNLAKKIYEDLESNRKNYLNKNIKLQNSINYNNTRNYNATLDKIINLLLFKRRGFYKNKIQSLDETNNIRLANLFLNSSIFNNFESRLYSKFLIFENFDHNYLSTRSNNLNYAYLKKNILKSISNMYNFNKVTVKKLKNKILTKNYKKIVNTLTFKKLYSIGPHVQDNLNNLTRWNGLSTRSTFSYKFKKYTKFNNFIIRNNNDFNTFTFFWYKKNENFNKKTAAGNLIVKVNPLSFLTKAANQLRTFKIYNKKLVNIGRINYKKLIENPAYLNKLISELQNTVYLNNLYIFSESVDKSFNSQYLQGSGNLPWFEYSDKDDKINDFSFILNFNEYIFDFEKLKTNTIYDKLSFNKQIKVNSKVYKKYIKINKLVKKYGIDFSNKRSKKNIWKIPIRWYFDTNFEKFIRFGYKNTLTCFYEKKYKLKRVTKAASEFSTISPKINNNFGISNFTNTILPVSSEQMYSFGFINNDIFFENKNMYNNVILSNTKYKNYMYNFFKKTIILPKVKFSFKEYSKSAGIQTANLKKYQTLYFTKNKNIIFDNFFQKKHYFFKILKNNNISDSNTKYKHNDKLNNFYLKDKKNVKLSIDKFDYSLRSFWSPNVNNELFEKEDTGKFNSFFVDKRFLGTFAKKITKRNTLLSKNINRFDYFKLKDTVILKFLNNNFRLSLLNKNIKESKSANFFLNNKKNNKYLNKKNLFYIQEDREISKNFINSPSIQKPHTFYGFIWDEYLKQSYGFSLNFLDFNEHIKSKIQFNYLKYSDLSSKNNQKRIENSTQIINNYTGLTKDSEISAILLSKYLVSGGFIKEISNFENLDEDFYKRKKFLFDNDDSNIKAGKKEKKKNKRKKKLKFKKYFKRELVRSTIYKSKLIKKSINLIKKYDEYPVGFKYNSTKNSINFPYFKNFFKIVNEVPYLENNMYTKSKWLNSKNNDIFLNNRAHLSKYSKLKKKNFFFNLLFSGKRKKRKYRLNRNNYLNKYMDFSFLSFKNKNKKLVIFKDKYSEDFTNNQIKNKLKRNLKKIKPKNRLLRYRLRRIKNTSLISYKKNRNKKLKNFRLNEKFQHNLDIFLGGGLPVKNGNIKNYGSFKDYSDIYNIRENFKFGDYYRFYNNPILLETNSNFLFSKNLIKFNDKKYKNILKQKFKNNNNFVDFNLFLKKNQTDSIFFENVLMRNVYKTDNISKIYQKSNYTGPEYDGFYFNFLNLTENLVNSEILSDFGNFNKNDNYFFNIKDPISIDYKYKNFEYFIYNNKISSLSGLSDKYTSILSYENYNLPYVKIEDYSHNYKNFNSVNTNPNNFIKYNYYKNVIYGYNLYFSRLLFFDFKKISYFKYRYKSVRVLDFFKFLNNNQIYIPNVTVKLKISIFNLFNMYTKFSFIFIFIKVYAMFIIILFLNHYFKKYVSIR